jgi:hypothetical protein
MVLLFCNILTKYKPPFTFNKDDILIGVNELVTSNVINRCLDRLHTGTLELLEMVVSQKVRYRWIDTIEIGVYPLKYNQTRSTGNNPLRWGEAIS